MEAGVNWKLVPAGVRPLVRLALLSAMNRRSKQTAVAENVKRDNRLHREAMARLYDIQQEVQAAMWLSVQHSIDISDLEVAMTPSELTILRHIRLAKR